jgi:ribonuclease BN (tRNA processing enzyme)
MNLQQNKTEEFIKILGAYGSRFENLATTCVQICDTVLIDAGNVMKPLGKKALNIDHIFISHAHFDHIVDIPFLIDIFFEQRKKPLFIYGLKNVLAQLKQYIFNWEIWPDFSKINLLNKDQKAINFIDIDFNTEISIENFTIKPIETLHTVESCGFVITKNKKALLFSSDTYMCDNIWKEINSNKQITTLIIDVSFPSRLDALAHSSLHLTPKLLKKELKKLKRKDLTIHINHLKPTYIDEVTKEIDRYNLLINGGKILKDGDIVYF